MTEEQVIQEEAVNQKPKKWYAKPEKLIQLHQEVTKGQLWYANPDPSSKEHGHLDWRQITVGSGAVVVKEEDGTFQQVVESGKDLSPEERYIHKYNNTVCHSIANEGGGFDSKEALELVVNAVNSVAGLSERLLELEGRFAKCCGTASTSTTISLTSSGTRCALLPSFLETRTQRRCSTNTTRMGALSVRNFSNFASGGNLHERQHTQNAPGTP